MNLWLHGGFPDGGVLDPTRYLRWQLNYVDLLCQRDLPAWGLPARPQVARRLFDMIAAVHGQTWNASQLGQSMGLTYHTINTYMDFLEGAFVVRRVRPYFASVPKRLARTTRAYIRDSGLPHALMGVSDYESLLRQPWVGASWEGFAIEQVVQTLHQNDQLADYYYLRTKDQIEADLLLVRGSRIWAIEFKLTSSPTPHDVKRLDRAADLVKAQKRFLVSQTNELAEGGKTFSCNLRWLLDYLANHWG